MYASHRYSRHHYSFHHNHSVLLDEKHCEACFSHSWIDSMIRADCRSWHRFSSEMLKYSKSTRETCNTKLLWLEVIIFQMRRVDNNSHAVFSSLFIVYFEFCPILWPLLSQKNLNKLWHLIHNKQLAWVYLHNRVQNCST